MQIWQISPWSLALMKFICRNPRKIGTCPMFPMFVGAGEAREHLGVLWARHPLRLRGSGAAGRILHATCQAKEIGPWPRSRRSPKNWADTLLAKYAKWDWMMLALLTFDCHDLHFLVAPSVTRHPCFCWQTAQGADTAVRFPRDGSDQLDEHDRPTWVPRVQWVTGRRHVWRGTKTYSIPVCRGLWMMNLWIFRQASHIPYHNLELKRLVVYNLVFPDNLSPLESKSQTNSGPTHLDI